MDHPDLVRLSRASQSRAADAIAVVTEPPLVLVAVLLLVCHIHTQSTLSGFGWAAVVALLIVLIPYSVVVMVGRWFHDSDRHLVRRDHRILPLVLALVAATIGCLVLWQLGPPDAVWVLVLAMLTGLIVMAGVNLLFTKISFHTAVVAGASGVVIIELGVVALVPVGLIMAAVAWARWRVGRHSLMQVVSGLIVGALPVTLVYLPLAG